MNRASPSLAAVMLASVLGAQPPRATNSIEFENDGRVEVAYNHLELGGGATLKALTGNDDRGARMRRFYNESGFRDRIAGSLEIAGTSSVAGNALDPGTYSLSFMIDDDLIWHLVVATEANELIFTAPLDITESEDDVSPRLSIQPVATDNEKAEGELRIRFGPLAAEVSFRAGAPEADDQEDGKEDEQ